MTFAFCKWSLIFAFICLSACKKKETPVEGVLLKEEPVPKITAPVLPSFPERKPYSTDNWLTGETVNGSDDPWVTRYLNAKDDEARLALIVEKEASGPDSLAPLLRKVLTEGNAALALQALESARMLQGEDALDILSGASSHSSEDIAVLAFEIARDTNDDIRLDIYANTVASPHPAVREQTYIQLSREQNKSVVPLLIEGLSDSSLEVRQTTRTSLFRIVGQEFQTSNEALVWWHANKQRFNERLVLNRP